MHLSYIILITSFIPFLGIGQVSNAKTDSLTPNGNLIYRYTVKFKKEYSDSCICFNENFIQKTNSSGNIIYKGNCKKGKVWDGTFYYYDENSVLITVENWKNGKYSFRCDAF